MGADWKAIFSIGAAILQWVKENVASGSMVDFRTKKDDSDKWVKGNIFADEDRVIVMKIGGVVSGLLGMGKSIQEAVGDDGDEE